MPRGDGIKALLLGLAVSTSGVLSATRPTSAASATFYVAPGGSDSSAGSETQPFATIKRGLQALQPGGTLYLRAGTYAERVDSNTLTIPAGTSWSSAVTVASYPGEIAVLRPGSGGAVLNLAHSYIKYLVFDRLELDAAGLDYAVSLNNGANHVRFQSCEIRNSSLDGIILAYGSGSTTYNEFLKLTVHETGLSGRGHGMYIMTSNNLVEGCEFYNANRFGVQIYNGYSGERADNNVVRGNKFHNCGSGALSGGGITIGCGSGNAAYNNVLWSNLAGIDTIWGAPANTKIYNNTVYGSTGQGITIGADTSGVKVVNNIAYRNGGDIVDYASGTQKSNNVTVNPGFSNPAAGDFKLLSGSGAIDAGATLAEVPTDFDGRTRPQGSAFDAGAFEFGAPRRLSAPKGVSVVPD
jgi:parallel beta-helix repeat protein